MTPESQRLALAKWAGWTDIANEEFLGRIILKGFCPGKQCVQAVPDYLVDLNAVWELEEKLHVGDWVCYEECLSGMTDNAWHATAAQRCEALLRTLSLWED